MNCLTVGCAPAPLSHTLTHKPRLLIFCNNELKRIVHRPTRALHARATSLCRRYMPFRRQVIIHFFQVVVFFFPLSLRCSYFYAKLFSKRNIIMTNLSSYHGGDLVAKQRLRGGVDKAKGGGGHGSWPGAYQPANRSSHPR